MGANDSRGGGGHGSKALEASGQLGRPGTWAPGQVLGVLQGQMVKQVAAGRYHSVAVTADGKVYSWGLNDWGQLGRPAPTAGNKAGAPGSSAGSSQTAAAFQKDERLPRRRRVLLAAGAAADAAAPPADAAAATQAAQTASSANSNTAPMAADAGPALRSSRTTATCYSGWSCHDGAPGPVHALAGTTVVAARAGRYSTVVLDAAGQLWTWGYDGCATAGQLPQQGEAWKPRLVRGQLQGQRVAVFDVGERLARQQSHLLGVQWAGLVAAGVIQPILPAIATPVLQCECRKCTQHESVRQRPRLQIYGVAMMRSSSTCHAATVLACAGYTFWLAATADGALYTCDTQDDGYAGTLPEKRKANHAGQLGRTGKHSVGWQVTWWPLLALAADRSRHDVGDSRKGRWRLQAQPPVASRLMPAPGSAVKGGGRLLARRLRRLFGAGLLHEPGRVRGALERKSVVAVAAGREHALVATADGQVFSFGGGRAVLRRTGAVAEPALVSGGLAGEAVQHVVAGEVSACGGLLQAGICMPVGLCSLLH